MSDIDAVSAMMEGFVSDPMRRPQQSMWYDGDSGKLYMTHSMLVKSVGLEKDPTCRDKPLEEDVLHELGYEYAVVTSPTTQRKKFKTYSTLPLPLPLPLSQNDDGNNNKINVAPYVAAFAPLASKFLEKAARGITDVDMEDVVDNADNAKDARIAALEAEVAAKDAEVAAKDAKIAALEAEVAAKDARIASDELAMDSLREQFRASLKRLNALGESAAESEQAMRRMLSEAAFIPDPDTRRLMAEANDSLNRGVRCLDAVINQLHDDSLIPRYYPTRLWKGGSTKELREHIETLSAALKDGGGKAKAKARMQEVAKTLRHTRVSDIEQTIYKAAAATEGQAKVVKDMRNQFVTNLSKAILDMSAAIDADNMTLTDSILQYIITTL